MSSGDPHRIARRIVYEVLVDYAGDRTRPPVTAREEHARAELDRMAAERLAAFEARGRELAAAYRLLADAAVRAVEPVAALVRGLTQPHPDGTPSEYALRPREGHRGR